MQYVLSRGCVVRIVTVIGFFLASLLVLLSTGRTAFAADEFYVIPVSATTFKGNWSISQKYASHDIVYYDGSSWFSLKSDNKGNQPNLQPEYWTLFARKGDVGPQGSQGPKGDVGTQGPRGDSGPAGPAGPAVHTSAICVSNSRSECNCSKTTVSKVVVTSGNCAVTSETGVCTGHPCLGLTSSCINQASCCVCASN
jgi:hypothetical protein